jgi:uncharacterized protein Yka (UPF0111/DUF47 family)
MSPNFFDKWEHILEDVEKSKIPIEFLKKIVIKLKGKRQHTINISTLMKQGLDSDQIEEIVNKKLYELDEEINNLEFILNVENIADTVQPFTDKLLSKL